MMSRRLIGRVTAGLLVVAGLVFVGLSLADNWQRLRTYDWRLDLPVALLSLLALLAALAFGVWVWTLVLGRFSTRRVRFRALLRVWFLSALARYVPGKVWQFVAAAQLAESAGATAVVLLTSMVVHMGFVLLAAVVVAALTLSPSLIGLDAGRVWVAAGAAVAAAALVHPAVLNAALRLVPRALHKEVLRWTGGWADGLLLLGLSVVSWGLYGFAFHLFVSALIDIPWPLLPSMIGVSALSFATGYIVFVAPAGFGAREAAMVVLLTPFAPQGVGAVVALLSRVWTIAAEVAGALIALALGGPPPTDPAEAAGRPPAPPPPA